jgi:hypothetical protein
MNMGVLFLYSRYASPSRFTSSGSSIAFNSQIFKAINSGVNKKVKLKDPIKDSPGKNSGKEKIILNGFEKIRGSFNN